LRSLDQLIKKAQELKARGLTTQEISEELKVQADTIVWLLLRGKERLRRPAPIDLFVDWSQIGSNVRRLSLAGWALADLARESIAKEEFEQPDVIVAVEGSGMVLGMGVAEQLDKPLAAVRPQRVADTKLTGAINPMFAPIDNKKVLIVDAVMMEGETIKATVQTARSVRAKPIGIVVLVNKSNQDSVDGVSLKSLIQLFTIAKA
jgi:orotate phosphoribosyltransferase